MFAFVRHLHGKLAHHARSHGTPYLALETAIAGVFVLGVLLMGSPAMRDAVRTYTNVAAVITAALVDMTNADRSANGVGQLVVDPVLTAAAQAKADDMAKYGYFAHFDEHGKGPWDWMHEAGYHYRYAGENLAIQFNESADVERAWLNSPAHRENLLDSRFTQVGIAVAQGMYQGQPTTFVVQFFGTPAPVLALRDTPTSAPPAPEPEPVPVPEEVRQSEPSQTVADAQPEQDPASVRVLGLVEDSSSEQASTTPAEETATSTVLLAQAPPQVVVPATVASAPEPLWMRFLSAARDGFTSFAAFLSLVVALTLLYAFALEVKQRHAAHAFSAVSLSAAFMIAAAVLNIPQQSSSPVLLDLGQKVAFASDTEAVAVVRVPNDGRYYMSGAPATVSPNPQVAAAATDVSGVLGALTKGPLIPMILVIAILAIMALALNYVRAAPERAQHEADALSERLTAMHAMLGKAEMIGNFGSFLWDYHDPSVSFWSDGMYAVFGLVKRKVPPDIRTFVDLADPAERPAVEAAVRDATTKPGIFSFTFKLIAPDKSVRFARVQGTTVVIDAGKAERIQGVAHDITKEMQVDQAKSEFVSLASHQLKTPLTAIRWLVEALQNGVAGTFEPQQREYIDKIGQSALNMIAIVNDLLNVSRIELGRLATQVEELDVRKIGQNVLDEQRHAVDIKHITIGFTCADDVPLIQADRNSLHMIFQNLISNAIKYTPEGGKVSCDLSLAGAKQQAIYLVVSDTGIGIPKDEQPRLFEKLHRASNAQALSVEGTGLGLYVVKTVIEKAGGSITFDSTEGKGTIFTVTIPLVWKSHLSDGIGALA